MYPFTAQELVEIMPYAKNRVPIYLDWLNRAMREFDILVPKRQAAFLAQLAHESGELRYVRELYSGEAYDVGHKARTLGNTPEDDGDGEYHRGAGLIQLTGKANQYACADHFAIPYEEIVDWLQGPEGATRSAAWFWKSHGCNDFADRHDFHGLTRRINGGYNGYTHRLRYWHRAVKTLKVEIPTLLVFEAFLPLLPD